MKAYVQCTINLSHDTKMCDIAIIGNDFEDITGIITIPSKNGLYAELVTYPKFFSHADIDNFVRRHHEKINSIIIKVYEIETDNPDFDYIHNQEECELTEDDRK